MKHVAPWEKLICDTVRARLTATQLPAVNFCCTAGDRAVTLVI